MTKRAPTEPKTMRTSIAWATHKFNPWVGCSKVNEACANCYACDISVRAGNPDLWKGQRRRTTPDNWRGPLRLDAWAAQGLERDRPRVFCASMADVFDNKAPQEWREDLWRLIDATPHLNWLLLTKRVGNAPRMMPARWEGAFPAHVWLGFSAGTQQTYDRELPKLQRLNAPTKFVSLEPLLEPIDLRGAPGLDWAIVGGESGPKARPMVMSWMESIIRQCGDARVRVFAKQIGTRPLKDDGVRFPKRQRAGEDMAEWPAGMRVRQYPGARA